jgi:hypothetical protein
MPARDTIHADVVAALIKDGWTITHDPYRLIFGDEQVYIDLGAERLLAAKRGNEYIAVEIKSFGSSSIAVPCCTNRNSCHCVFADSGSKTLRATQRACSGG